MIFNRIPTERINWVTSSFLIGTLVLTLTAVPVYLWFFGINWFQIVLFITMFYATGHEHHAWLSPAFLTSDVPGEMAGETADLDFRGGGV